MLAVLPRHSAPADRTRTFCVSILFILRVDGVAARRSVLLGCVFESSDRLSVRQGEQQPVASSESGAHHILGSRPMSYYQYIDWIRASGTNGYPMKKLSIFLALIIALTVRIPAQQRPRGHRRRHWERGMAIGLQTMSLRTRTTSKYMWSRLATPCGRSPGVC